MRSFLRFFDAAGRSSTNLADLAGQQSLLDRDALAAYLSQDVPVPDGRTLYSGIVAESLPDAWGPPAERPAPPRNLADAIRTVRLSIERSIEEAIGSARRVVVLAGGGIDSSVLLALTIEVMKRRGGTAFAVAIDFECPGDDRPHMLAVESRLKCEVVRVRPEAGARHVDVIREGIDAAPALWPFNPLHLALFAAAREHGAEVMLTGTGGDHFFDGDPRAFASLVARRPLHAISSARALEGFDDDAGPRVLERIVRPIIARRIPRSVRRFVARRRRAPPPSVAWAGPKLLEITPSLIDRKLEWALSGKESSSTSAYFDHPQRRHIAWLIHQEQRVVGMDRFDPYFTPAVGEAVFALPPEMLLVGGRRRGLLREMMRGVLPDSVLDRMDKAEFAPAFRAFFAAAGGVRAFAGELEGRNLGRLGLVDPSSFKREATRVLEVAEEDHRYGHAWAAVAAEAFLARRPELT